MLAYTGSSSWPSTRSGDVRRTARTVVPEPSRDTVSGSTGAGGPSVGGAPVWPACAEPARSIVRMTIRIVKRRAPLLRRHDRTRTVEQAHRQLQVRGGL